MPRNLIVTGPPQLVNPKAVILQADSQQDSITLIEATNTPGKYTGTLLIYNGLHDVSIEDDFGPVGLYVDIEFPAGDPITVKLPNVPTISGGQYKRLNQSGQEIFEKLVNEQSP